MRDTEEYFGTEKKNIAVDSLMAQAQEAEANAAYLRKAGSDALLGGWIKGGADLVSGFAKSFPTERVREAETFGGEVERYLSRRVEAMKPRAYDEVERHLRVHSATFAGDRLGDIDRRAVALRLAEIETASGPVARNRSRSSLSAFFTWAVREGLLETNPVHGSAKADEGSPRERVLTDAELGEIWRALPNGQFGEIVRLLILTGQRREEIGALRWSEVDLDRRLIVLPPARTKNRRQHELPISPAVLGVLSRQPRRKGRDFIFGISGASGFSGWADCKARLDAAILERRQAANQKAGKAPPPWRLHDLRRTAATGMAELGVLPHIIEAVLNHVSGHRAGVAGVYNRARYEGEMRAGLDRWAEHVEAVTRH